MIFGENFPLRSRVRARAWGLDARAAVCLVLGAVDPYKGMEEILDAWRAERVKNIRLAHRGAGRAMRRMPMPSARMRRTCPGRS